MAQKYAELVHINSKASSIFKPMHFLEVFLDLRNSAGFDHSGADTLSDLGTVRVYSFTHSYASGSLVAVV